MGIVASIVFGAYILGSAVINAQPAPEPDYMMLTDEDASNSYNETLTTEQDVSAPETGSAESGASSDLSSVSYLLLDNSEPEALPKSTDSSDTSMDLDNWLRLKLEGRIPLTNAVETEILDSKRTDTSIDQDNWLRLKIEGRNPLTNAVDKETSDLRDQRIEYAVGVARIPATCDETCQTRREFAELTESITRHTKPHTRSFAETIISSPTAPIVNTSAKVRPIGPPLPEQVLAIGDSVMLGASP
jgi:hypothetical protein